ncbi:MAG: aminotransferase class I/II-fold pyridoxal phosphate-dependent enzyme [Chitinophagaceae bacterium]|nr:aminotransferase class I/II-fold pyridoxal phosphate-dependent enzyme [Chitinophagaceae bacterium]MBP6045490.1 aminotransferase class I/II-fold pyridoxal phosphate-dependent enzyme [Ferruginibacter sp.]MBK7089017.1 aminotransferase class I/II-fold pyridoxal phosphate-dependent enzyme [Chitinophagaceae bacterium]MBK7347819.1 aminotransferase class I/II-fold pyridoxal phosphate-dependent enzyme [Chitinophagaceae bacterium]MBK7734458.1 aminotransferase class I/II-fold pyridoxal phosphate-depend
MTPVLKSKLPHVGTTIFTIMSSLAVEHKAINLGQGFPDFEMNEALIALVNKAMKDGHNQYVHMNGLTTLREQIAEKIFDLYNTTVNASDEITITPGGTYAIYTALTTILQKGDEVIIFEPAYDCYIPAIELNGAKAVPIPLSFPEYTINWDLVKEKINPNTRAIIINSPHNPSGKLITQQDIEILKSIVAGNNIFIISDEVYEHLVFDNLQHYSLAKYPELYERAFICFSFGKVYHCTGWKLGYCIAPPALMKEFRKIHQFNCFTCNSPMQYGIAAFLKQKDKYLELGKFLQQKRDFFMQAMSATRLKPLASQGSYFQLYSYATISNEPENDFAVKLVKEYGVACIPVSAFCSVPQQNRVLRFCFAKKEETLQAAANLLKNI